jgi:hypothetical protein
MEVIRNDRRWLKLQKKVDLDRGLYRHVLEKLIPCRLCATNAVVRSVKDGRVFASMT